MTAERVGEQAARQGEEQFARELLPGEYNHEIGTGRDEEEEEAGANERERAGVRERG